MKKLLIGLVVGLLLLGCSTFPTINGRPLDMGFIIMVTSEINRAAADRMITGAEAVRIIESIAGYLDIDLEKDGISFDMEDCSL